MNLRPADLMFPTTELVGETTAKKIKDEIWGYLMGSDVQRIGVCGMGGAGKTTIVKHINNKLQEEPKKFENVIWITVSQDSRQLNLLELQNQIAAAFKAFQTVQTEKFERGR